MERLGAEVELITAAQTEEERRERVWPRTISIPALRPTLTCDTDPVSKVKRRHGTGSRTPQEATAQSFPSVPSPSVVALQRILNVRVL